MHHQGTISMATYICRLQQTWDNFMACVRAAWSQDKVRSSWFWAYEPLGHSSHGTVSMVTDCRIVTRRSADWDTGRPVMVAANCGEIMDIKWTLGLHISWRRAVRKNYFVQHVSGPCLCSVYCESRMILWRYLFTLVFVVVEQNRCTT